MILRSTCNGGVATLVVVASVVLFAEFVILNNTGRCSVFIAVGDHRSVGDDEAPTLSKRIVDSETTGENVELFCL